MKRVAAGLMASMLVMPGLAMAESWQATFALLPSSPKSCPTPALTYELSLEGARLSGRDPTGQTFEGTAAPDGSISLQYQGTPRVGTLTIVGNARTRQLELFASARSDCRYALKPGNAVPTVGNAQPSFADVASNAEWALGRWDGILAALDGSHGGTSLNTRPRSMIIAKASDGRITCRWSYPESVERDFAKSCRIGDGSISLITSADSDVKLTRTGANSLVGTFITKSNQSSYYGVPKVFLNRKQ